MYRAPRHCAATQRMRYHFENHISNLVNSPRPCPILHPILFISSHHFLSLLAHIPKPGTMAIPTIAFIQTKPTICSTTLSAYRPTIPKPPATIRSNRASILKRYQKNALLLGSHPYLVRPHQADTRSFVPFQGCSGL